jgi:two-component system cell cycle response regulator
MTHRARATRTMPKTHPQRAEMVPVLDRYRWMLACRSLITVVLTAVLLADGADTGRLTLIGAAGGWLVLSYAAMPGVRRSRRTAAIAFSLSLLGDAALLSCGWWLLGGPGNRLEFAVAVHILGVTLLASFRTGIKLALWYSVLAYLIVETAAAGLLAWPGPVPLAGMVTYLAGLWLITLLTAGFAAVNERELRRRRYDSEVLRRLGIDLNRHQRPEEITERLATFARDDMLAARLVVLAYPEGDPDGAAPGFGLVAGPDGDVTLRDLRPEAMDDCVRSAGTGAPVQLVTSVDAGLNPTLAGLLPAGGRVLLLPFAVEQARGVVAVQFTGARWGPAKLERRVVATLHQATLQAGMAMSRELLSARLTRMAETDALTGLANRGTFNRRLAAAVAEAATGGRPFGLVLVDLDHFKRINDTYGHQAGDAVLKAAAGTLKACCPPEGLAARYGGEEFALILPGLTRPETLARAEQVRRAVEVTPTSVAVTASLGTAVFPLDATDGDALLAAADSALYRAKESGRNRVGGALLPDVPLPR